MNTIACRCSVYEDIDVDEINETSPVRRFKQLRRHPPPQWWLFLGRCQDCLTFWLVAQEERLNDVYVIARLTDSAARKILEEGSWPHTFQQYAELLQISQARGHTARYATPIDALPVCQDLVAQEPNIQPEEVARLLNISVEAGAKLLASTRQ